MGKEKMFKVNAIGSFVNVFQNPHFTNPKLVNHLQQELEMKGKWKNTVFKNENPLNLELACGKGDYTLALAQKYPNRNYIGVDAKGARIFTGAKNALEKNLSNIAFARMRIENILNFFEPGEVDEIWITFPDPFPKKGDAKRRLSANGFLDMYQKICKAGAVVHFKTDDLPLFHSAKESIDDFGLKTLYYKEDIYACPLEFEELSIQTYYEKSHLANGRTINYLKFQL
ncbi:MAG: tRNA (guanosine(46)-N7)-methyltransferase TrmB [Bacteroidetes bacterium]|nr:tRNA (guanosine(46)-N7)-methyltransferase TrmB [Bacteroidota bacterium]